MVKPTPINPKALGRPVGYANGYRAGGLLHVAGQIGSNVDPDGRHVLVPGGFVPQFEKAVSNILAVVAEAGGRPESIVEMTVFVKSMREYRAARKALGDAWRRTMGRHYPAMTLVAVSDLFEPGALLEIKAVAAVD